jgi:hypothetical protein
LAKFVQPAFDGSPVATKEIGNVTDPTMSEFHRLVRGINSSLTFVQGIERQPHHLLNGIGVIGNHQGILPTKENPLPGVPVYQPNAVPKRPNATVNKIRVLRGVTRFSWGDQAAIAQ